MKTTIIACETQPVTLEGLRALLNSTEEFQLAAAPSPSEVPSLARAESPSVALLDKGFGSQAVVETLARLDGAAAAVVWGSGMTDTEAIRFLRSGARGVLAKSAEVPELLTCLRAVAAGMVWTERRLLPSTDRRRATRSHLTTRETEVMELVGQGMKNREVARELGIRPGTVKVHLKHIFEKTGVGDRYGLVLTGLTCGSRLLA